MKHDIAIAKHDEPDTVTERSLRSEVSLMPSGMVVMSEDEDVDECQAA